jgi:DNA-directed RNA polymerase specialized sigma24 family protein
MSAMTCFSPVPPVTDEAFVLRQAARRSTELVRRGRIRPDDEEDFRQELILDILEHGHQFDPNRGNWSGFVRRLMRNRSETLMELETRRRNIERPATISDDDDFEEQPRCRSGSVDASAEQAFVGKTQINLVLSRLPDDLRSLADQLCWMELDDIARARGVSKQWLHKLKLRLRRAFIRAGIMPPGWDPARERRMKRSAWR